MIYPNGIHAGGCELDMTCTDAPAQIEGTVDGFPVYFRSRHKIWTFVVGQPGEDISGETSGEGMLFFREGESEAGWLDQRQAWATVLDRVAEFRTIQARAQERGAGR